jgi:hypothetical protein
LNSGIYAPVAKFGLENGAMNLAASSKQMKVRRGAPRA